METPIKKKPTRRIQRPKVKKFLSMIDQGASIKAASLAAGLPKSQALRGRTGLPLAIREAWAVHTAAKGAGLIQLGEMHTPQQLEKLAMGRLVDNTVTKDDRGARSAELILKTKRINAFAPENMMGVIVIEAPRALPTMENMAELQRQQTISHLRANLEYAKGDQENLPWAREARAELKLLEEGKKDDA